MAVVVLTHPKMPSYTLLFQKKFKNTQRAKTVDDFSVNRRTRQSGSHPVAVGVLVDLTDPYGRVSVACEKV
jgi:hypothetical protein